MGQFQKWGGRKNKKKTEISQFQFGNIWNGWEGGGFYFPDLSELLSNPLTPSKINRIYLVTFFGIFYCKYDFSMSAQWNLHSFWTFKMKFCVFQWKYAILDYVCSGAQLPSKLSFLKYLKSFQGGVIIFQKCLKLKNVWNNLGQSSSYWLNGLQTSTQNYQLPSTTHNLQSIEADTSHPKHPLHPYTTSSLASSHLIAIPKLTQSISS